MTSHPRPPLPWAACLFFVSLAASCGHGRLVPDESARLVADEAAVGADHGVRVVATFDDWRGLQEHLPEDVTPIKIRIVNHGEHAVRVLYEDFRLKGKKGRVYRALPVVPLEHPDFAKTVGPIRPIYASQNFQVAPRYHDVYPALPSWPTPLSRDERLHEEAYRQWGDTPPTQVIRRQALPEGVLGAGGAMTGYLYFESPLDEESRLQLKAVLASGTTGAPVARISIPLRVD